MSDSSLFVPPTPAERLAAFLAHGSLRETDQSIASEIGSALASTWRARGPDETVDRHDVIFMGIPCWIERPYGWQGWRVSKLRADVLKATVYASN